MADRQPNPNGHIRTPDWLSEKTDISWNAKAVWSVCRRLTPPNSAACYPSYETLARMTGLTRRAVLRAVDELEQNWLLEIRVVSKTGKEVNHLGFRSNLFIVHDDKAAGTFLWRVQQPGTKQYYRATSERRSAAAD